MKQEQMSAHIRRRSVKQQIVTALIACTLVAGSLWGILAWANQPASAAAVAARLNTERVVVAIEGMVCDNCARGIKAMLKRTPGVTAAEVSFEKSEAVVDYDTERTSREKIVEAIAKMGYKASVKQ